MSRTSRRNDNLIREPKINAPRIYQVGIYARLSVEDREEKSITAQIDFVREAVQGFADLCLHDIYIDNGKSGTNFVRKEFLRMMKEVRAGVIDCIAVKDLSRLGRSYIEACDYMEQIFPLNNIRFIAVNDNYDSIRADSPNLHYSLIFKNLVNDIYAKDISRKIRSSFEIKQMEGKYLGSYAPYGYRKDSQDKNRLVPDEEAALVVQQIFQWRAKRLSAGRIERRLNEGGIPSIQKYRHMKGILTNSKYASSLWSRRSINRDILRNEVYIGNLIQGKKVSEWYRGIINQEVARENWIVHKGLLEPLIDQKLFARVQELMDQEKGQS